MTSSKQTLSTEQKKALLKKLRSNTPIKDFKVLNKPTTALSSATIINIPIFSNTLSKITLSQIKKIFENNTIMVNHYSSEKGDIGLFCIPYFLEDLSTKNFELTRYINKLIPKIEILGAKSITLAGNLSSATGYLKSIKTASKIISTGHATTVASVILTLDAIIKRKSIDMNKATICFLGMGSIGQASFDAFTELNYGAKEIIISDTKVLKNLLSSIKAKHKHGNKIRISIAD